MTDVCQCGHHYDDHDSDDEGDLGCLKCSCPGFMEGEAEDEE